MDTITSYKTLIGSLYKKLNKASSYGTLNLKTLLLIDIINEYIYDCPTCYNTKVISKLKNLVFTLQNRDNEICSYKEAKSNYTNIVGCRDCNLNNNNNLIIINDPPLIEDPDPIEPEPLISPRALNINTNLNGSILNFSDVDFNDYFVDTNEQVFNIKITSLPTKGVITLNDINITLNQIIPISNINSLEYVKLPSIKQGLEEFNFQLSGNINPNIFSNTANFNINLL